MRKYLLISMPLMLMQFLSDAQTYLPITNNMVVPSNSNIKIVAGSYSFADTDSNGIIRLNNVSNVIIDGDSVSVDGLNLSGYMIYIHNCDNVLIKNFHSVSNYFYALHADSSQHILITNCNFSYNRSDTVGFLDLWTDQNSPNGGGIFMNSVRASAITDDTMQYQNDGAALYHCDSMNVSGNVVSWNEAYGVKLFYSDSCLVSHNNASHINRSTGTSDCASVLLYFSRVNSIVYNDCSYSGDGIFTNANLNNPNSMPGFHDDNYFGYNYCSYSPHNAIESVFTDGNVFKHNVASFSNYGLWGGYAINSVIDSNTFAQNQTNGIAIEHGLYNTITHDSIYANGQEGVYFYADTPALPGYSTRDSHGEIVDNNWLSGNSPAIDWKDTYLSYCNGNTIAQNALGILLESTAANDTISNNTFSQNVSYNIDNLTPDNIQAPNNQYNTNDTSAIECKIFDHQDSAACGTVYFLPFIPVSPGQLQLSPPADMCEQAVADWGAFVQDGAPTMLSWDSSDFRAGTASLKCVTQSGFLVQLHYYPANNLIASWDLSAVQNIHISFKAADTSRFGFQVNALRLGNSCGGYFEYNNPVANVYTPGWTDYTIPIAGDATWVLSTTGAVSLSDITYAEVDADTWDYGFTLWVDGFYFDPQPFPNGIMQLPDNIIYSCHPNPANDRVTLDFPVGTESIEILNQLGQVQYQCKTSALTSQVVSLDRFASGMYLVSFNSPTGHATRKLTVMR